MMHSRFLWKEIETEAYFIFIVEGRNIVFGERLLLADLYLY